MLRILVFLLLTLLLTGNVRAESVDERFLAGLRERHQYRLAEVYSMRRWARDDLSDRDRAELAVGLALVYTDHALASPPGERIALWIKADNLCEALLADWPDNPRVRLVEVQRALVSLARGRQQREEGIGTANESAAYAEALTNLRAASAELARLADAVDKELIARRMRGGDSLPDAFSTNELQSLLANITFHLARAQHQLGLCYAPQTPDRDDALLQALRRLEPLAQQTEADDLVWNARLEVAACQRELGQLQQAWERLDAWSKDAPPADVAARVAAERVRLLLAGGRLEAAGKLADQALAAATVANGDLALAHLEASLAAWKAASRDGRSGNADQLTTEVTAIGRQHGPFWARQAQLLVGRALAHSAPTDNAAALLLAAKNLYLNDQADEALAAYDRATALFERSQQVDEAFTAAMTAAAIERQSGRLADAAGRYRQLSLRYPRQARAAEAHRLAILCVADLLRENTVDDPQQWAGAYDDLLAEHLGHWPHGPTADEVRWWLGRLLVGRHDWAAAREVLEKIVPSSPHFQAAVYMVVDCYEHELEQVGRGTNRAPERAELLASATNYLQPIVAATRARPPAEWTELERSTVVSLAQLHLRYADGLPTYAVELLGRVIRAAFTRPGTDSEDAPDAAWQQQIVSLYIVALARVGKVDDARDLLQWQADKSPSALPATLEGLGEILSTDGRAASRDMAELVLEGLELLGTQSKGLDRDARRKLVRLRASALDVAGHRQEALAAFAQLAEQMPDDGRVQESYAALLAGSDSAAELREALPRWQQVEQRSRAGSPRWRRARQARIDLLTRLGDDEAAEKLQRLTRLLYPDWERRRAE